MKKLSHWDYSQFLLVSQVNYTQTYFGEHSQEWSHDQINRLMRSIKLTPRELREAVREDLELSENGYILFDDTVIDKNHSFAIEVVRRQWSGNAKKVIKGIGVVTCVYVNPEVNEFWMVDYRIYDPERDGKSKITHLLDMWQSLLYVDSIPFHTVLMDSWYASMEVMKSIEKGNKIYYCPIKCNRLVTQKPEDPYQRVDSLTWDKKDLEQGKSVHLKKFPAGHEVKLFRLVSSTGRTDYLVTNDQTQESTDDTRKECAIRWKIEQFHREAKQVTGVESCQCRLQRAQRNHIACAMLVWVRLNQLARQAGTTIYQLKQRLLDHYMKSQLLAPSISIRPA